MGLRTNLSRRVANAFSWPFYVGTVEALCFRDPLFDLIIRNVSGARRSDDPNLKWGAVTAEATRAQARSGKDPKPLKMKEVTDTMWINRKNLVKMQKEDPTLQKLKQLKGTKTRKGYVVSYEKQGGIRYRIRQRNDDVGDHRKQILVPKSLRERVMGVAHDSPQGDAWDEEDGGSYSDQFLLARFARGYYQFLSVL